MAVRKQQTFRTAFEIYTAYRQVGGGGAGSVFEARDSEGHPYAVKVLDRSKTTTAKLKRFKNEIQFCANDVHKNVIRVLDHGAAEDGAPFYVMRYYPSTLRQLVVAGLKPANVLPIFGQMLDGIQAAHLYRVFHRDVKPENVLHDPAANVIVVADFGIARFKEEDLHTMVKTGPHDRLANFAYAAPEQRSPGQQVDGRADIYALGLILNEMYTGRVPHGTGFKRIGEVAPEYSYLDELVDSMLHQDPERRVPSVAVVKEQLIARGNQFLVQQRLSSLRKEVVPETEIDDPLLVDPIRVVAVKDYRGRTLRLKLNRQPNPIWIRSLQNIGSYTFVAGEIQPQLFSFDGDEASISVDERRAQQAVDLLKTYILRANDDYASHVRKEHQRAIEERRRRLQDEISKEEQRERMLKALQV